MKDELVVCSSYLTPKGKIETALSSDRGDKLGRNLLYGVSAFCILKSFLTRILSLGTSMEDSISFKD